MKSFRYTIKDVNGIHARPAGLLVKECTKYSSEILIEVKGKSVQATKLLAVLGLLAKQGDEITVLIEGSDEDEAFEAVERFVKESL